MSEHRKYFSLQNFIFAQILSIQVQHLLLFDFFCVEKIWNQNSKDHLDLFLTLNSCLWKCLGCMMYYSFQKASRNSYQYLTPDSGAMTNRSFIFFIIDSSSTPKWSWKHTKVLCGTELKWLKTVSEYFLAKLLQLDSQIKQIINVRPKTTEKNLICYGYQMHRKFPFKIPMNKTNLFICSAISDARRFSITSAFLKEQKSSCWASAKIMRFSFLKKELFLGFYRKLNSFHLVWIEQRCMKMCLLFYRCSQSPIMIRKILISR